VAKHFQIEIERLNKHLLAVGTEVLETLRKALTALEDRRPEMAKQVIEADQAIDVSEVEIEEECLKLLALYQPVAEDLRAIAAVMKINNDLERMGDEAVNIAEHAAFLASRDPFPVPPQMALIAEVSMRMVRESLEAFVYNDVREAARIIAEDDEVDRLNREVIDAVAKAMRRDPETIESAMHVFSVSRHLERIADHATNIAEDVVYIVEGTIIRHRAGGYTPQVGAP
jgi:phosphate transport system protein